MTYQHFSQQSQQVVTEQFEADRTAAQAMLEKLEPGGCVVIESFSEAADSAQEFLRFFRTVREKGAELVSQSEQLDTRTDSGAACAALFQALWQLDETNAESEPAKNGKNYKGRKPIPLDSDLFESVLARWRSGLITARQAMREVNLKPNTFYRRVKERDDFMKNGEQIISAAKELGKELKIGLRAEKEDLKELADRVITEARDGTLRQSLDEKKELVEMELSMKKSELKKDLQDVKEKLQLRQEVRREAKNYKQNAQNEDKPDEIRQDEDEPDEIKPDEIRQNEDEPDEIKQDEIKQDE